MTTPIKSKAPKTKKTKAKAVDCNLCETIDLSVDTDVMEGLIAWYVQKNLSVCSVEDFKLSIKEGKPTNEALFSAVINEIITIALTEAVNLADQGKLIPSTEC
jgi:hypothetical protein